MTSPPAARMLLTYPVRVPSEEIGPSPPHAAVQLVLLAASMKANVRNLSPAACASADSSKPRLTSWYGATRFSVAAGLTASTVALPAFPATATAASHDRLQEPRQLERNPCRIMDVTSLYVTGRPDRLGHPGSSARRP